MKIKFSKVLAIACALSVVFAGLTAFAAPTVTTTTAYVWDDGADTANILVNTDIAGMTENDEVTYYVSKVVESNEVIVYINQATVGADGTANFQFTDVQGDILTATARFGTDATLAAGYKFPTFYLNEGANLLYASVDANTAYDCVAATGTDWGAAFTDEDGAGYAFKATVSGNVTEYGIEYDGVKYPAVGCDANGVFIVALQGFGTIDPAQVTAYAVGVPAE